jgi:hypothetical protein
MINSYKIHHCEMLLREDVTVDDVIDVIEGNRRCTNLSSFWTLLPFFTLELLITPI